MTDMDGPFDVIVVGAGSAGAPAAAALSADPAVRVLLIEAGRDWRAHEAPAAMLSANINPFMNDIAHQAQWQWPGLQSRRTRAQAPRFYWRGRGLGGSSMVNAQIAIRGVGEAFDGWAEAGCEGWGADSVLSAMDGFEDDPEAGRPGGPLPVYRAPQDRWGPVDRALRDAALALGYNWNPDLNARGGEGVSCYPINSRDGRRVSVNEAFLEPARTRPNLTIMGDALVDRVVFDGRRATGVRLRHDGALRTMGARQVLLCAGAVHTPAILMRSGIGPAGTLQALGIGVVHDNPHVGQHFMDHPVIRMTLPLAPAAISVDPNARHTNCCVTYSSGLGGGGRRDMILIGFNHRGLGTGGLPSGEGAIGASVFDAFSRGSVALASADPAVEPVVDENMLDDPRDRMRMRDAVRRLAAIAAHPAVAGIAGPITLGESGLSFPAALALPEAVLDSLLLEQAADIQHAAGTCRMTAYEDPRGVVDPDLAVKGVESLQVADASIMPTDCRANLHWTCVAIGVLAARHLAKRVS